MSMVVCSSSYLGLMMTEYHTELIIQTILLHLLHHKIEKASIHPFWLQKHPIKQHILFPPFFSSAQLNAFGSVLSRGKGGSFHHQLSLAIVGFVRAIKAPNRSNDVSVKSSEFGGHLRSMSLPKGKCLQGNTKKKQRKLTATVTPTTLGYSTIY